MLHLFQAASQAARPQSALRRIAAWGLPGVFLYSLLDSSPIPVPGGGADLLTMVLAARHREPWFWYCLFATLGSIIGAWIAYEIGARGATHRWRNANRPTTRPRATHLFDSLRRHSWTAVLAACFMPPPFPFTLFLFTAGAARIPRARFLSAFALGRLVRFGIDAWLGDRFGRHLTHAVRTLLAWRPTTQTLALAALALLFLVAAALWLRHRRPHAA